MAVARICMCKQIIGNHDVMCACVSLESGLQVCVQPGAWSIRVMAALVQKQEDKVSLFVWADALSTEWIRACCWKSRLHMCS